MLNRLAQHTIAVIVAITVTLLIVEPHVMPRPAPINQAALKYSWGDMSEEEKQRAAQLIGDLDRREVEIFCGLAECSDLANDIDMVMDDTHAASTIRRPVVELGAGLGIVPKDKDTVRIADAIKQATGGRIDLKVIDQSYPGGGVAIALGAKPRK